MSIEINTSRNISYAPKPKIICDDKGKNLIEFPDTFTIIDVETTGFDSNHGDIIEIGALKVVNNKIVDEFQTLLKPRNEIGDFEFTQELTGITPEILVDAASPKDSIIDFKRFIEDFILIGHNVNFDINFLYDYSIYFLDEPIANNFVDTLRLSKKVIPNLINYKLVSLANLFDIEIKESHRALEDCYTTFKIYENLITQSEKLTVDTEKVIAVTAPKKKSQYIKGKSKSEINKSINTLIGLITGIKLDSEINVSELEEISNWCLLHSSLRTISPFTKIFNLFDANNSTLLTSDDIEDILWLCSKILDNSDTNEFDKIITSAIQMLEGLVHGLLSDNILSDKEILQFQQWIENNQILKGTYPYDDLKILLNEILKDETISEDERGILIAYFGKFINTKVSMNINEGEIKEFQEKHSTTSIFTENPNIQFVGNSFCLTGDSTKVTKKEFAELIESKGGLNHKNVTLKTTYLVVGDSGSEMWTFSSYGRKVEKALENQKKGNGILIISEIDFWNSIHN